MTPAEVCSYLRGRLQMRVQVLEDGRYALSPLPRDTGGKSWDPECWDLPNLCEYYGIPLWKVGLAPEPIVLPYPVCECGHRYDHHRDNRDPRGGGCWQCSCVRYLPKSELIGPTYRELLGVGRPRPPVPEGHLVYLPPVELGPDTKPCMAAGDGVVCTREQGHTGDHAAHNLRGEMVKRWPAPSLDPLPGSPVSSDGT